MNETLNTPREGFADGHRHGWTDRLCSHLERMIVGRHAARWLAGEYGPIPRAASTVFVLPSWRWSAPAIDIGRKALSDDGGSLLMPVRLSWPDVSPVIVVKGGAPQRVAWTGAGLGHTGTGVTDLVALDALDDAVIELSDVGIPLSISQPVISRTAVLLTLRKLVEDGQSATWESLTTLEPLVRRSLDRAHAAVVAEVTGDPESHGMVDTTTLERIGDEILFGTEETDGHSFAFRLLSDRCTRPGQFARVDPLRYVTSALRSEAEVSIRREIGDPHIGRKVRAIAREIGTRDVNRVISAYRERHPTDHLANRRAAAALSVTNTVMYGYHEVDSLMETVGVEDDTDATVTRLDKQSSLRRRGVVA